MTVSTQTSKPAAQLSLPRTALALLGHYLGGRRGLIVLGLAAAAGLYASWGWLAAVGIAPLLVALAPCAAMCALGLCAHKMGGKSCSTDSVKKVPEDKPGA
ncbi:MAG: hypothetical protein ACT4P4_21485 [Betaproteobacteria bacterium]